MTHQHLMIIINFIYSANTNSYWTYQWVIHSFKSKQPFSSHNNSFYKCSSLYNHSLLIVLDITHYYLFDRSTAYSIFDFIHIIKSKDNQIESTDSPSTSTSLSSSSSTLRNVIQLLSSQLNYSYQQKLVVFMDNFTKVIIAHYHLSKTT